MTSLKIKDIDFNSVPDKRSGVKIERSLTQSNVNGRGTDTYVASEDFYKLVNAIDIDWNGILIDNQTINDTSDLISWITSKQDKSNENSGYIKSIYTKSQTKPALETAEAQPAGWTIDYVPLTEAEYNEGLKQWVSMSYVDNNNVAGPWSSPMCLPQTTIVNTPEEVVPIPGPTGGHYEFMYKNSTEEPQTPTGGTTKTQMQNNGWTEQAVTPDFENGEVTYMTQCYIDSDGNYGTWSQPCRITGGRGATGEKGDTGEQGPAGKDGLNGTNGVDGAKGEDGKSSYFHVAYANKDNSGNIADFSLDDPTGKEYIGTYVDDKIEDSNVSSDYAWMLAKGAQGDKGELGITGSNGADGSTSYLHIKYSNDGSTFTDNNGETPGYYLGQYVDFEINDSGNPSDYRWALIRGLDGKDGKDGVGINILGAVDDASELPSVNDSTLRAGDAYMVDKDLYVYTGSAWKNVGRIKGEDGKDGSNGLDGLNGSDGLSAYVHIAWANSADGSVDFAVEQDSNKTYSYMGVYCDNNPSDSTDASKYVWTKVLGEDGADGKDYEFVYTRNNTGVAPGAPITTQQDDWSGYSNGITWTDNPQGVTENLQYEYVSTRKKVDGKWSSYSAPVIWAKWGEKGQDGDGYEYIYKHYETEQSFKDNDRNPAYWDANQVDDYLGPEGYLWSDDPVGVTEDYMYEYVAMRKKTNGQWSKFSTPVLWSNYALDGLDGQDGGGYSMYYKNATSVPELPDGNSEYSRSDLLNNNWATYPVSPNVSDGYYTYMTQAYFYSGQTKAVWSKPIRITGSAGKDGKDGKDGLNGENGVNGADGTSTYFHVAYANKNATGEIVDFSLDNPVDREYIGTYVDETEADSQDPSDYKWMLAKGAQGEGGEQGIPGENGKDGKTSYLHIKYSNDGRTFTDNNGEDPGYYLGQYVDFEVSDSADFNKYKWALIRGVDGEDGKDGVGINILGAFDNYVELSLLSTDGLNAGDAYLVDKDLYVWTGSAWKNVGQIKGEDGKDGTNGVNGSSAYVHIAYATSADGTENFSTTQDPNITYTYIGIYCDSTVSDSDTPSKYTWSLIKGEDGTDGRDYEFIYTRNNTGVSPETPNTVQQDDWYGEDQNGVVWTDHPSGVAADNKYEFISTRSKTNGTWSSFSTPVVWSKWGEKGADGDGFEYIYKLTQTDTAPDTPVSPDTTDYVPTGWSDDPQTVNENYPYQWVCVRKRKNGVWGAFSAPAMWSVYIKGDQGEQGEDGKDGYTIYSNPAAIILTQDVDGKFDVSSSKPYIVEIRAVDAKTNAAAIVNINSANSYCVQDNNTQIVSMTTDDGVVKIEGVNNNAILNSYLTGFVVLTVSIENNAGYTIRIPVSLLLTGTWESKAVGDAKIEIAKSLIKIDNLDGVENVDDATTVIENMATYVKSSRDMTNEIKQTIGDTTFTSYMSQTANNISLGITNDLSNTGIDINNKIIKAKTDNFVVVNNSGETTFSIDQNGNLLSSGDAQFSGKINATSGSIGGWEIDNKALVAGDGAVINISKFRNTNRRDIMSLNNEGLVFGSILYNQNVVNNMLKMDGSGSLAKGAISWDQDGNLSFNPVSTSISENVGTRQSTNIVPGSIMLEAALNADLSNPDNEYVRNGYISLDANNQVLEVVSDSDQDGDRYGVEVHPANIRVWGDDGNTTIDRNSIITTQIDATRINTDEITTEYIKCGNRTIETGQIVEEDSEGTISPVNVEAAGNVTSTSLTVLSDNKNVVNPGSVSIEPTQIMIRPEHDSLPRGYRAGYIVVDNSSTYTPTVSIHGGGQSGAESITLLSPNGISLTGDGKTVSASCKNLTILDNEINSLVIDGHITVGDDIYKTTIMSSDTACEFIGANYKYIFDADIETSGTLFQASDETLKNKVSDISITAEQIAEAPAITYTWKDSTKNLKVHAGTIAQYWQNILPQVISETNNGKLNMDYQALGVVNSIMLAKEIVSLKEEIAELKKQLKSLG